MIDRIVFDVEIQKRIDEVPGGWNATHLLGVAVCTVYEYRTDRFRIYGPSDVERLQTRLLEADELGGFNIVNFDLPVVFGIEKNQWMQSDLKKKFVPKCNDILRRIWVSQGLDPDIFTKAHGGVGLDAVVKETLGGPGKISNGESAPIQFQAGNWAWCANYCTDDVALEKKLSDFVERYGYVIDPRTMRKMVISRETKGK